MSGWLPPGTTDDHIDEAVNGSPDDPPRSEPDQCRAPWCTHPIDDESDYLCDMHRKRRNWKATKP